MEIVLELNKPSFLRKKLLEWRKLHFQLQSCDFVQQLCRLAPPALERKSQEEIIEESSIQSLNKYNYKQMKIQIEEVIRRR